MSNPKHTGWPVIYSSRRRWTQKRGRWFRLLARATRTGRRMVRWPERPDADTGVFTVLRSTDLQNWADLGFLNVTSPNFPGITFTDTPAQIQNAAFYRVK